MADMLIRSLVVTLLVTAPAITAEPCSQIVNVTTSNAVVIVSVGNVSFVCDFDGEPVTSWMLNEQFLLNKNGTLDITTDVLFGGAAVSYVQCFSENLVYNITAVLVTSELQVKLCNYYQWSNASACAFISITPSLVVTQNWNTRSTSAADCKASQPMMTPTASSTTNTPAATTCVDALCIVRTVPYIATVSIGGSAVLVLVCMVVVGVCSRCRRRKCTIRKTRRPSMMGSVVVNPLAWERPVELTPLDLSQASFAFSNTRPK